MLNSGLNFIRFIVCSLLLWYSGLMMCSSVVSGMFSVVGVDIVGIFCVGSMLRLIVRYRWLNCVILCLSFGNM